MQIFDLEHELSNKITSKRLRSWRWTTSASCVRKNAIQGFAPIKKPELGDLALVQVISIGATSVIEESSGGRLSIFPGSVFVGAFANRYAPDEFEGIVPEQLDDSLIIDLLNVGGTLGRVLSGNSRIGEPTKVKLLAFLKDKDDNIANTLNYSVKTSAPRKKKTNNKLIIVTGTSMNSGKSNTAKAITYALTTAGKTVVAGKVTGTAAKRDILLMKTAGAIEVCDFTNFGYPSTYLLPEDKLLELFWSIYRYLDTHCDKDGYIVLEIADGIFQREAEILLNNSDIKSSIDYLAFSCCDSLSAVAGIERLENKMDLRVSAISGPAANSPLGLREIKRFFKTVPAFNNMILDVTQISKTFSDVKPQEEEMEILPEAVVPEEALNITPQQSSLNPLK